MNPIEKLKRERKKILDEMRAMVKTAEKREKAGWEDGELDKYIELDERQKQLKTEIDVALRQKAVEMELANEENVDGENRSRTELDRFEETYSLREMLSDVHAYYTTHRCSDRLGRYMDLRAASGANIEVASDAGFLVGTQTTQQLLARTYDEGILASRCTQLNIGNGQGRLTLNGLDESSRVDGSRYGGVLAAWGKEAETVNSSASKFHQIEMIPEKLMAFYYATEESIEDTFLLESHINSVVPAELAHQLDAAIFDGDGVGKPLGIMNSPSLVSISKESGQAADTVVFQNIVNMYARLWIRSHMNAVWLCNQNVLPQLHGMKNGDTPVYLPANGLSGKPYDTLYGRPLLLIEDAETLGDKGDIVFADLSQYLLLKKGNMRKDVSIHVKFLTDQRCFRFIVRTDGKPAWHKSLTQKKGSYKVSPFITLNERA